MHHERLVEPLVLDRGPRGRPDVHHGALRHGREQLVRRLGGEDGRPLRLRKALRVHRHAVAPRVEGVEAGVGEPCFVEVEPRGAGCEGPRDLDRLVAQSVVRGVGEHRVLCLGGDRAPGQRVRGDGGGDRRRLDPGRRQRPRESVSVPGGDQVHRPRAREDETVQDRLVAVAVHQSDLVTGDAEMPDHAVTGRIAVQNEIRAVGAEDPGGIRLRIADRAGVFEERAEFLHRDRQITAQNPFPEIVVEGPAHR